MKKYKLYRYILSQSVSLMMLVTFISAFIVYLDTGRNLSMILVLAIIELFFNILENARLFKKLADNNIDITKLK